MDILPGGDHPTNGATMKSAPLNPATLVAPTKVIAGEGGALYLCDDATWIAAGKGQWAFPPEGWGAKEQAEWTAIQGRKIGEGRRRDEAVAAVAALIASPATMLAQARLEVDAAVRERLAAERKIEGERAWLEAQAKYGTRLRRLDSEEGDVFILRPSTEMEITAMEHMVEKQAAAAPNELAAKVVRGQVRMDGIVAHLAHPKEDRARIFLADYPLFLGLLTNARDEMIFGMRVDEGKGSAP